MAPVAVYLRISRADEDDRRGVERQRKDCLRLVKARGWTVKDGLMFIDNDVSAYSRKARPEWVRMLTAIEAGEVSVVVAWANDRLYRRTRDQLDLMEAVAGVGGTIVTVKDGEVDPSTAEGQMRMTILASIAQFESHRKSERILAKHAELAANGLYKGGPRPFGYKVVEVHGGKSLEVVPEEAEAIRDATQRIIDGQTLRSVVRRWNNAGLRTSWDNPWEAKAVKECLTSRGVAGLREHRGEVVGDASWPAIVERGAWDRVVDIFDDPARKRHAGIRGKYMLTGLAVCGICGAKLVGNPQGGKPSYVCISDTRYGGCGKLRVMADRLEEFVANAAAGMELAEDTPVVNPDDIAAELRVALATIDAELAEYMRMKYAKQITDVEWRAVRAPMAAQKAALEAEIATAARPRSRRTFLRWTEAEWAAFTTEMVESVVERVTVKPVGKGGRWVPVGDRVDIEWRAGVRPTVEAVS